MTPASSRIAITTCLLGSLTAFDIARATDY